MDRETFWTIIDAGKKRSSDVDSIAPVVTQILEQSSIDDIISFVQHQKNLMGESYRYDLWAIAYIMNGGCSDDGFEYFRAWLMANGFERWVTTLENPESIGDWVNWNRMTYEYEEMIYVGVIAYRNKTGKEFPYEKLETDRPLKPIGNLWQEHQLEELYPKLSRSRSESWPPPPLQQSHR